MLSGNAVAAEKADVSADAVKLGIEPPTGVPAIIQARAYSSPVWYRPEAIKTAKK
jgi:hypothetical protein